MITNGKLYNDSANLVKKYGAYLGAIDECVNEIAPLREAGRFSTDVEKAALATMLDNAVSTVNNTRRVIDEAGLGMATQAGLGTLNSLNNIETTLLDLYTGTAVKMLAYEVVAVQPISTPQAYLYYFDYSYVNEKGGIKAGQSFLSQISSKTAGYAGSRVFDEVIANGSEMETSHTLKYLPLVPGELVLTNEDGTKTAKDDGTGKFVGDLVEGSGENSIDYLTGEIKLKVETGSNSAKIKANYRYDTTIADANPIQADLKAIPVTAEVKTLKATSTLTAVLSARATVGVDLSATTLEVAIRELAAEFDYEIFQDLYNGANNVMTIEKIRSTEEYQSFIGRFDQSMEEASNTVYNATQKLDATFVIAGTNFASVLAQSPKYVPAPADRTFAAGAKIAGYYNGKLVIKVPNTVIPSDSAVIGAKSDIPVLGAGYIFAPFIMAYPSQLFSDPNLRVSQGFLSMAAKAMVNKDLYLKLALV